MQNHYRKGWVCKATGSQICIKQSFSIGEDKMTGLIRIQIITGGIMDIDKETKSHNTKRHQIDMVRQPGFNAKERFIVCYVLNAFL